MATLLYFTKHTILDQEPIQGSLDMKQVRK